MPLRRLVHGGHAGSTEFFLDGLAVREGGSETVEIIAHGLVEYRILNIEQGILKWWWTLRSSIFRVGYWIFIMCLLGESRDGDTPTALVVTTSKLAAPPNRLSPKRPRANETSVYRQIAEPRLQPWSNHRPNRPFRPSQNRDDRNQISRLAQSRSYCSCTRSASLSLPCARSACSNPNNDQPFRG